MDSFIQLSLIFNNCTLIYYGYVHLFSLLYQVIHFCVVNILTCYKCMKYWENISSWFSSNFKAFDSELLENQCLLAWCRCHKTLSWLYYLSHNTPSFQELIYFQMHFISYILNCSCFSMCGGLAPNPYFHIVNVVHILIMLYVYTYTYA